MTRNGAAARLIREEAAGMAATMSRPARARAVEDEERGIVSGSSTRRRGRSRGPTHHQAEFKVRLASRGDGGDRVWWIGSGSDKELPRRRRDPSCESRPSDADAASLTRNSSPRHACMAAAVERAIATASASPLSASAGLTAWGRGSPTRVMKSSSRLCEQMLRGTRSRGGT